MAQDTVAYHRSATTGYMYFTLKDGADAYNLTSVDHVEMFLIDKTGHAEQFDTDDADYLFINAAVSGIMELRPTAGHITYEKGPYRAYFLVFVTGARAESFPEDGDIQIIVMEA